MWGMASIDWGRDEPPHESARPAGVTERLPVEPGALPEVQRLTADGWYLAPEAPMWCFLPAVWPRRARTWVPDRATRYLEEWRGDETPVTHPWPPELYEEMEADAAGLLASAGVEARPANRLWLLRVPPRFPHLDDVLDDLMVEADKRGAEPGCNAAFVDLVAVRIRRLFND